MLVLNFDDTDMMMDVPSKVEAKVEQKKPEATRSNANISKTSNPRSITPTVEKKQFVLPGP